MSDLPMAMSLAALAVWALALGGIVIHRRSGRPVPAGVIAAIVLALAGTLVRGVMGATLYAQPTLVLTSDMALASHVQRALLVLTGLWALALLVRARRT